MEDQATQLRKLVEGRNINGNPPEDMGQVWGAEEAEVQRETAVESMADEVSYDTSGGYESLTSYREAQSEVSEPQPVSVPPVASSTIPVYTRGSARTIAITSGKGGVGKTSIAVNLAIALGLEGKRVIIIDADLGMANVDILLGTSSKHSLMDLLNDDVELEDVIQRGPYGVSYISGGSGMEHAGEYTEAQRRTLFEKLARCDEWADIILIDTGAGIGRTVLDFIVSADEVLLVTTPEPTALTDAYAMVKAYEKLSSNKSINIVVNRVYEESEARDVSNKLARTARKFLNLRVDYMGCIFDDRSVLSAVRKQVPLLSTSPDSVAAKCIRALAKSLINGRQEKLKLGWTGFLKRLLNFGR